MKKNLYILIAILFILISCNKNKIDEQNYETLKQGFFNPPSIAKPKVYWWCLNGNIDTLRAKQELMAMKEAGIGGFDFFEIGVPKGNEIPRGPAFLSKESLKIIKFIIDEADELGLSVGFNLASSWNAGGSWVKPEHGGKSLYRSIIKTNGGSGKQSLKIPFPEVSFPKKMLIGHRREPLITFDENGRPDYYENVAILAVPKNNTNKLDTSQVINVTKFFDKENDILNWETPPGEWEIQRYICSNSGQQVVMPSPLSAGLTIDHFDSTAVETHLLYIINKLQSVLGDFKNTALKSFYLASYEARGFVWTSSLVNEFNKQHGYDISKLIPIFFEPELFTDKITQKVQADFKKTLSELMINNLYRKSKEICNQYGLKINSEAGGPGFPLYNGPAEPLKALGSLDIPRGEFWINHSRYYMDSNEKDSIDVLNIVKEVSAASHIYQKGIVEEEAFTSFQHWQEGPFDIKPNGDKAFCEGMNRVVFHGFSHNITGSGYPGYVYSAGTHFNDKRVWWPKVKPFVEYLTRLSYIFQETDFVADVLYYYGDKIPNAATPKNTHFRVGAGYDYEVINSEILINNLEYKNGKLVLSNGAEFSILALEYEKIINPEVLVKLIQLAEQGAIIVGGKPDQINEIKNQPITADEGNLLINKLWSDVSEVKNTGKIYSKITPVKALEYLNISPDIDYVDKEKFILDYIHYKKEELNFYFVRNTTNQWISRNCSFRSGDKVPEVWNPILGEIIPISIYKHNKGNITIPLTLPPKGSQLIVFKNAKGNKNHYTQITEGKEHPPKLEFKKNGTYLLTEKEAELEEKNGQSIKINNYAEKVTLQGSWEVLFPKKWGAPEKVTFPKLISWTDSKIEGIRYFSGLAAYHKKFQFDVAINNNEKYFLDLGELSKIGEVWLNGENLGITWAKPYRFDITEIIKQGDNELIVEIANVWSNRLVGDAITSESFTNTNINKTIVGQERILAGDQTRVAWADVPLIKSGLLGPVQIISTQPIETNKTNKQSFNF